MERIKKAVEQARIARDAVAKVQPVWLETSSTPVSDPADIEYRQTKTISVPADVLDRSRVLSTLADDEVTAAYKMLRTQVLQHMTSNGWTTLAVTSPGRGDGKTLTAVNLAVSIARELNFTVLLTDLDLHRGGVHECFGYEPDVDLVQYLEHDVPLSSAMFNPGIQRLVILPSVGPVENSSELLTSPKMQRLVGELKSRYPSRFLLFDLPPLLATDDALAFLPAVDAVLLVVQDGETTEEELRRTSELLENIPVVGTVLNRCRESVEA
jgi:Mrp family chromosome partitioning ATPase